MAGLQTNSNDLTLQVQKLQQDQEEASEAKVALEKRIFTLIDAMPKPDANESRFDEIKHQVKVLEESAANFQAEHAAQHSALTQRLFNLEADHQLQ